MYYFIVNEHGGSGKAKKTWNTVKRLMRENNIEYKAWKSEGEGHATKLVKRILETENEEEMRLVVVGGDGTFNEALNGISDFDRVRVGLVPTGSGNDFARGAGIPQDTRQALEKILYSKEAREMDLGLVTTDAGERRVFAISSGIGLDAIVCKMVTGSKLKSILNRLQLGKFSYILMTVYTVFSMEYVKVKASFDGKEPVAYDRLIFLAGMNMKTEGGGVPMAPEAKHDDGLLSVCIASGLPKWRAFLALPQLMIAKHTSIKGFSIVNCRDIDITAEKPVILHADGEYGGEVSHVHITCLEKKLHMML